MDTLPIVVAFTAGIVTGVVGLRELIRWMAKFRTGHGPCQLCRSDGYLILCRRCARWVAMCCYIQVHGTDDPGPNLRKRRGIQVCVRCLTTEEKNIIDGMIEGTR